MANLKEVRNRIVSVNSTMQITSAMKMVSAAKLKKAQDTITAMRPYAEKLSEILGNVSATLDLSENRYADVRPVKNVLILAVTSNRGLCGGFNNNIIKQAASLINGKYADVNVKVVGVGKKSHDWARKADMLYKEEFGERTFDVFDDLNFTSASTIAEAAMELFLNGDFDEVVVVYNSFKNAATQIVKTEQLLPMTSTDVDSTSTSDVDFIFEPSKEVIINELIPKALKLHVYKALADSFASEHGARMTAMHKATDNAGAMVKELKLTYNKARQAAITNEILEIVAGAEALG